MIQLFWDINNKYCRTRVAFPGVCLARFFLAVFSPLALAQGQGSYGGYLGDVIGLALGVGLVIVLFVLFVIYKIFGGKVAVVLLVLLLSYVAYLSVTARNDEKQRLDGYQTYLVGIQSDCLKLGGETILTRAKGSERVFVRMSGEASIPEFQNEVLLKKTMLAPDISFVEDATKIPADADAVLVSIAYSRIQVAGSLPNAERFSTRVQVEIKDAAGGSVLAKRTDIELRQEFCLGEDPRQGVIDFMKVVLNRADLQIHDPSVRPAQPFRYIPVVGNTAEKTGQFQKVSTEEQIRKPPANDQWFRQQLWMAAGPSCTVKDVVRSSPAVYCGSGTPHQNELKLGRRVVGISKGTEAWFAVFEDFRGMRGMDAFRVEQRDFSGKPLKAWVVNFPLPQHKEFASAVVESVELVGNQLKLIVNWKPKWCIAAKCQGFEGKYFERQTTITATLAEL